MVFKISSTIFSGDRSMVSTRISGFSGTSNGASTPVKFLISPALAFLYNPLTSLRSHSSIGVSTKISIKSSFPIISRMASRFSFKGEIKQFMVISRQL